MSHSWPSGPVRCWHDLTTVEAGRVAGEAVLVLPLAAVEQHGPHLPLSTDIDIANGILAAAFHALPSDLGAYALPVQAVGTSDEHADWAGTLTVPAGTLGELTYGVGASLARSGVRRLVLFNSHGGNRATLDTAGLRLRREHGLLVVKASYFRFPRPDDVDLPDSEWEHGLHGGAVETSMMLHLRPELVRTDELRRFPSLGEELEVQLSHVRPEGPAPFSWTARDLSTEGVVGDAAVRDGRAIGERLVEHYGRYLAEIIHDAHAFPLSSLDPPEGA